jgi:uncharacterized protein YqjF (DUF2071 family)
MEQRALRDGVQRRPGRKGGRRHPSSLPVHRLGTSIGFGYPGRISHPLTTTAAESLVARQSEPARRQSAALAVVDHRPWPLPERPWLVGQTWRALAFLHWPVAPEAMCSVVPRELPLDLFGGHAWIGITPFEIVGHRLRGVPPVPVISRFEELNVRTYVTLDDRPGIHFLSLDAASLAAVLGARAAFRLPYFRARMQIAIGPDGVRYRSRRLTGPRVQLVTRYRPTGAVFTAAPGTLEHWLTERYCLYTLDDERRVLRGDIHHPPWPLQPAEADIDVNTMTAELAIDLDDDPLLHYARRQDVVFWSLQAATEPDR